jgi:hypothetical protein
MTNYRQQLLIHDTLCQTLAIIHDSGTLPKCLAAMLEFESLSPDGDAQIAKP